MRKDFQLNRSRTTPCAAAVLLAVSAVSCGGLSSPNLVTSEPKVHPTWPWLQPSQLAARNFFEGPFASLAPVEGARYELIAADSKGYSAGYDVRDAQGVRWSVKVGKEAQPEVTVSRILSGLGFHQPP